MYVPTYPTPRCSVLSHANLLTFSDPQNYQYWPTTNSLIPDFFLSKSTASTYLRTYILYSSAHTQPGTRGTRPAPYPGPPRTTQKISKEKKLKTNAPLERTSLYPRRLAITGNHSRTGDRARRGSVFVEEAGGLGCSSHSASCMMLCT